MYVSDVCEWNASAGIYVKSETENKYHLFVLKWKDLIDTLISQHKVYIIINIIRALRKLN